MKKYIALFAALLMLTTTACYGDTGSSAGKNQSATVSASKDDTFRCEAYAKKSAQEICDLLTLAQKAAQMVQPAVYNVTKEQMQKHCYGSILSKMGSISDQEWRGLVQEYQLGALMSEAGIPFLYGQDDVHGVNYCSNAVYFPHNIGIGAANDPSLTYQMGLAVADEAKLCNMLWNFAPCVAQSADPRWGRTYESYGADLDAITKLSTAFTKGLVDGGVVACAKHFFGDGNVAYGSGENSDVNRLMDRGDAQLSEREIDALLAVYQAQIDAGVQTIMVSHSSLNGVKMHENAEALKRLKQDMHFKGFIISDWDSVQNTSPTSYQEQVVTAVNAGIDMLMEVDRFEQARQCIIRAVESGDITEERLNDAVTRILQVKLDAGIFADPLCGNLQTVQTEAGSDTYRQLAEQLVEKSLVLLKNEKAVLPLKSGTKVYITGPAADHPQAQCGGWTIDWNESPSRYISGVTTIEKGFADKAEEFGITLITDAAQAEDADVVLLVVGEQAYAEWNGDTEDLALCGALGLDGNQEAIEEAKALDKPTVCCVVAGRQVLLGDDYEEWDGVVMCYLPGSEGQGVANVLCGKSDFSGQLPSPWYGTVDEIGTGECWLPQGYGLRYSASAN